MTGKKWWFLEKGTKFTFHTDETIEGDNTHVSVTYKNFPKVCGLFRFEPVEHHSANSAAFAKSYHQNPYISKKKRAEFAYPRSLPLMVS